MPWMSALWPAGHFPAPHGDSEQRDSGGLIGACRTSPSKSAPRGRTAARRRRARAAPTTRRRTAAVVAMRLSSPDPTASAICRTPLLWMPMPAKLWASSATELYSPIRPTPAGPRNRAIALVRTTPTPMFTTDEPPIIAVDFRIWAYWCLPALRSDAIMARSSGPVGASGTRIRSLTTCDVIDTKVSSGSRRSGAICPL